MVPSLIDCPAVRFDLHDNPESCGPPSRRRVWLRLTSTAEVITDDIRDLLLTLSALDHPPDSMLPLIKSVAVKLADYRHAQARSERGW
jgi:hypothetical protein